MHRGFRFKWNNTVGIEPVGQTGKAVFFRNTVADNFRAAVAAAIAGQAAGSPTYIAVGTGALTEYALSNANSQVGFNDNNFRWAQGFQVSTAGPVSAVAVPLRRQGNPAGSVYAEIQTNNAGKPSNTVITNGTSKIVPASYFEYNDGYWRWVVFEFPDPLPQLSASTQYHLVLRTTGYTYDVSNYISIAIDSTSPTYANGYMNGYQSDWFSETGYDMIFKVLGQTDGLMTQLRGELSRKEIVSRSKYNTVTARLLANFGVSDAVDLIGEVGLFDASTGGNLLAVATVQFDKSANASPSGINVYWLIEVLSEDA